MPIPMASSTAPPAAGQVTASPFPAKTKQVSGIIGEVQIDVTTVYFADKILMTVTQQGRLPQWVHVPLESNDPTLADRRIQQSDDGSQFLPMPHLTATTILGGGGPERETVGQLYAAQIASALASRDPEEKRLLVLGVGLKQSDADREMYLAVLDLMLQCI